MQAFQLYDWDKHRSKSIQQLHQDHLFILLSLTNPFSEYVCVSDKSLFLIETTQIPESLTVCFDLVSLCACITEQKLCVIWRGEQDVNFFFF